MRPGSMPRGSARVSHHPDATTTLRARHVPRSVRTTNRSATRWTPLDGGVGLDRCAERTCVAVEVSSEVGCAHVAVGVGALVVMAGKTAHPVRGEHPQRVPALAQPALTDTATVHEHVVAILLRQVPADREAGLSGVHRWLVLISILVLAQISLGIATLLSMVQIDVAVSHQGLAFILAAAICAYLADLTKTRSLGAVI